MSDLDQHRGKRRHVQFKMRRDLYEILTRLRADQSANMTARDLLEKLLEKEL